MQGGRSLGYASTSGTTLWGRFKGEGGRIMMEGEMEVRYTKMYEGVGRF